MQPISDDSQHEKKKRNQIIVVSLIIFIVIITLVYTHDENFVQKTLTFQTFSDSNFEHKHPPTSKYNFEIRKIFDYLQATTSINAENEIKDENQKNNLKLHPDNLKNDKNEENEKNDEEVDYSFSYHVIENDILNHKYVPFQPLYKSYKTDENESFKNAEEKKPYDLDPVLYWNILLQQILNEEKQVNNDFIYVDFFWYDFINNVEYNNFLRNLHLSSNSKEIWDKIGCSFLNDEIFNNDLLKKLHHPVFYYNYELYRQDSFISEHVKRKYNGYLLDRICNSIKSDEIENKHFNPKIIQNKINFKVRPEVYHLQSMNRIFNTLQKPISIGIINIKDNTYKQVFVKNRDTHTGDNYVTRGVFDKVKDSFDIKKVNKLLHKFENLDFSFLDKQYTNGPSDMLIALSDDDFTFDIQGKYEELLQITDSLTPTQKNYLESIKHSVNSHYSSQGKYLIEADEVIDTHGKGTHHDHRFFRSMITVDLSTFKVGVLQGMLKTFTAALKSLGLMGWMSHGNMYGWMYNGLPFPYDEDIDFQLPLRHMHIFAEHFNQSVLLQDPRFGYGRYFVDFGNIGGRTHGNGNNNIDGRLIDMDTGLYIDITGLSFNSEIIHRNFYNDLANLLNDKIISREVEDDDKNKHKVFDYSYFQNQQDKTLSKIELLNNDDYRKYLQDTFNSKQQVRRRLENIFQRTLNDENNDKKDLQRAGEQIIKKCKDEETKKKEQEKFDKVLIYINQMDKNERYAVNKALKLVTCRNKHFVNVDDYKILINTFYQQSPIVLPVNYMDLLHKEYSVPKSYDFLEFKEYIFQPNINTWMKSEYLESALDDKHYNTWIFSIDDDTDDNDKILNVDKNSKNYHKKRTTFTLEETEIILFNMCDFDDKDVLNIEEFNKVVDITNWRQQFPQSSYRFRELAILNEISPNDKNVIDETYVQKTQTMFKDLYQVMVDFELGINNDGKNKLYKDSFEFLKDIELLHGHEIYGYDMTEVCRNHIYPIMKNLEDSKFKEINFLEKYNHIGKPVWEIPYDSYNGVENAYNSINHDVFV